MKPPQGRLRENCNRSWCVPVRAGVDGESLNAAAIMESLTATTKLTAAAHRVLRWWKELLSVSSWVTWSNTSSPWGCGAWGVGGGGAVWHRVATCWDFFFFVRRILVVYGQFKKINKSNKSYEIEHHALSEWKNQDTAPLCIWITWLHKQVHATSIRLIPHLFCLLTDYRER